MAKHTYTRLDRDTVRLLGETDEVDIEPGGPHQQLGPRTIWVVSVDGGVYIRSRRAAAGNWYLRSLADRHATLVIDGRRLAVSVVPVVDAGVIARVSDAYRRKYGARWPEDTDALLTPGAEAATLRVVAG